MAGGGGPCLRLSGIPVEDWLEQTVVNTDVSADGNSCKGHTVTTKDTRTTHPQQSPVQKRDHEYHRSPRNPQTSYKRQYCSYLWRLSPRRSTPHLSALIHLGRVSVQSMVRSSVFSSETLVFTIVGLLIVDRGAAGTCYNNNHLFGYEGWTARFSEEQGSSEHRVAPIRGMYCSSNWCDEKMLKQGTESVCAGDHIYWTSEFSKGDTARQCNDGYYVSQMHCSGSRCENVKLLCRRIDSDVCEFTGGTT
eukprot:1219246-Rhodomonas_salina.1